MTLADAASSSQNPFAILTLLVAPAILTNASSILALSTSNRFLRVFDRIKELGRQLETAGKEGITLKMRRHVLRQLLRCERQARHFLGALKGIYLALSCFAAATSISLLGALLVSFHVAGAYVPAVISLLLGLVGVGSLVWAGTQLIQASFLAMSNISEDVARLKEKVRALHPIIDPVGDGPETRPLQRE